MAERVEAQFYYTPEDLYHGVAVTMQRVRKHRPVRKVSRINLAFVIWTLWGVGGLALVYWISSGDASTPGAAPSPRWLIFLICAIPIVLVFGFVLFLLVRRASRLRHQWDQDPIVTRLHTLAADDTALKIEEPLMRLEYRWPLFWAFDETDRAFVLYTTNPRKAVALRYHSIPKHAFPDSESLGTFRNLLQSQIRSRDSAFPVVQAPVPVLPIAEGQA